MLRPATAAGLVKRVAGELGRKHRLKPKDDGMFGFLFLLGHGLLLI
jgi:hypothetical protein